MTEQFNIAVSNLIDKLQSWFQTIVQYLPNFILAVFVMLSSYIIGRYVKRFVQKIVAKKIEQTSVVNMIAKISAIVVVLSGLFLSLGILNLGRMLTSLLAGAGVAGLAVGLALQGTLANTIAGVILSFRKKIRVGDWVETTGFAGEVMEISLKDFTIKEADNNMVVIPNKTILENPLKNYSLTTKMRVFLECGVGYESNLVQVETLTKDVISKSFSQISSPNEVEFYYTEFGSSSINYLCRFWIDAENMLEKMKAKSKAIIEIKKAYNREGINIPFPIRTLQFGNNLNIAPQELESGYSKN